MKIKRRKITADAWYRRFCSFGAWQSIKPLSNTRRRWRVNCSTMRFCARQLPPLSPSVSLPSTIAPPIILFIFSQNHQTFVPLLEAASGIRVFGFLKFFLASLIFFYFSIFIFYIPLFVRFLYSLSH